MSKGRLLRVERPQPESPKQLVDPVKELRKACALAGSQAAWALKHRVNNKSVNDVLTGRREVTKVILKALGIKKVVLFTKD